MPVKFGVRMPSAFAGGSILDLPPDAKVLARGFYVTYDKRTFRPTPRNPQNFGQDQASQAKNKETGQQDSKIVLEAMQRILRKQPDKPRPFSELGQSRPIR